MDNNANVANQNPPPVAQADQSTQTQPQAVVQPIQPVQPVEPVEPVGSVNKEASPVSTTDSEFLKPTEVEPEVSQELKEAGVEAKSDKPSLTYEHKDIVDHAGSNITVSTHTTSSIKLPMTEDEIADKLKAGQDDDSGKWLAGLIQKIIKAVGL